MVVARREHTAPKNVKQRTCPPKETDSVTSTGGRRYECGEEDVDLKVVPIQTKDLESESGN